MTPELLFERIDALVATAPFTPSGVTGVLGGSLRQTSDSDYFTVYEGAPQGFSKVTVMEAKAGASNGGSVALVLTGTPCVNFDAARRFGWAHKVPTHPGSLARPLELWTYAQPWGDLLLAYDPATGCLAEATLRAH